MDWLDPSAWWALAFVALAAFIVWHDARSRRQALARFAGTALVARLAPTRRPGRRRLKAGLALGGLLLLVVALAGPRYGTKVREVQREGVDLMIALDVSASMRAQDVAPNRLERAKNEIKKLLDDLTGDRVGLVVFAGDAFVQCPLTTDYDAVRLFLDVAEPEQIATPGTNFRAAVRTAVRAFEASAEAGGRPQPTNPGPEGADPPAPDPRSRALLVVSDGENHVGDLSGIQQTAREAGVRLFAAGVGETGGARIPRLDDGRVVGYKRDRSGQVVRTRLEEDALRRLSADGAYFRIARTSSALADLRAALAQMEQTAFDAERFEEYENVYQWPLALALLLLAADPLVRTRRRQQGEDKG